MNVHAENVPKPDAIIAGLANGLTMMQNQNKTNEDAGSGSTAKDSATRAAQSVIEHGSRKTANDQGSAARASKSNNGPQARQPVDDPASGADGHSPSTAQVAGSQTQSPVSIAPAPGLRQPIIPSDMQPSVRVLGPTDIPRMPQVVDLTVGSRKLVPNETSYNSTRVKTLQPTDGRPSATPAGLHGKTNTADGSFGMIQIDLAQMTRGERIAAAQRSSETTAAAAAGAKPQWNDPRHHQVWKNAGHRAPATPSRPPSHQTSRSSATPTTPVPAQYNPTMYRPMAPADLAARGWPITIPPPNETKADQARLLELFRTIHPSSIVDQLCKGLSFFGGAPGQAPPADGNFPPSDKHNGSGALFVRWLSEIFPPVEPSSAGSNSGVQAGTVPTPASAQMTPGAQGPQPTAVMPVPDGAQEKAKPKPRRRRIRYDENGNELPKRPRGRPPGSGNKHPRRDKGVKKGSRVEMRFYTDAPPPSTGNTEPSSVAPKPLLTPNGKRIGRPPGSKNKPKAPRDATTLVGGGSPGSVAGSQQSPSRSAPIAPMGQNGMQSFPSPQAVDSSESDSSSSSEDDSDAEDSRMETTSASAKGASAPSEVQAADSDRRLSQEQGGPGSQPYSAVDTPAESRKRASRMLANRDGGSPDASQQLVDEADLQSKRQRLSIGGGAGSLPLDSPSTRPQAPMSIDHTSRQQQTPPSPVAQSKPEPREDHNATPTNGHAGHRASFLTTQQQQQQQLRHSGPISQQYHRAAVGPQQALNMDAQPLTPGGEQQHQQRR